MTAAITGAGRLAAACSGPGAQGDVANTPRPEQLLDCRSAAALLLFMFGYGVTLDLRRVPVAVVIEQSTPDVDQPAGIVSQFALFQCHSGP